jgi:ribosomal protein S18 acetylase RimI-like enzyme
VRPLDRIHQYLHANARARNRDAEDFGVVTLYLGTAMDESDNVVLANTDDPGALLEALAEARDRVNAHAGRTNVRLIQEQFPNLASAIESTGFRQRKREPLFTCTREQLRPADAVPGLTIDTLTSMSPLAAIQETLDVNERGFDPGYTASATEQQAANFRRTLVTARAFTAHLNGETVAGGMYHTPLDGVTQFSGIATLEPYRQRGIAAALTTVMIETAFAAGVDFVYLAAANAPARRVYERLGFQSAGMLLVYQDAAPPA